MRPIHAIGMDRGCLRPRKTLARAWSTPAMRDTAAVALSATSPGTCQELSQRCNAGYGRIPKRNTVRDVSSVPGRRIVDGNCEWFGESGKCCVSRHSPARRE
jgi:hypothetical protein